MPNTLKYTDDALIHHLYLTMRAFTKGVNEVMKPLGLYSSEWTVLNFVAKHDSFPQSDIAAALEIEGAAISKTLSKMEQKGLIVRTSSQDKREKRISLTEKGRELYPLAAQAAGNHRSAVLAGLSRDDRQQMLSFIQSMLDHIHSD
ncbi:MarR family winged helix-turn-helix transcriptional regulator [Megasphaera stantonii]|uniref:MarR family winged helix-turn-helix transcriptional regulator n=1 Tax=Megasphaera stantonii TaxID=2144175 RepID=UPI001DE0DC43|nr:MarR family transcriptional regulator [Megasphaera stantonii]HJE83096.1 MarR family transcriptional regulator [Megasphaera stantonii]